jgi:superfamily II DNA or RNA helicase
MSYFRENYINVAFPIEEGDTAGLRRAQLGAIHAIAAYFSLPRSEAGIVVMPTGSGKTVVIALAPFILRANRVLILTPSQLVRSQISEQMSSLGVLKRVAVLPLDVDLPKTKEIKERINSDEGWKEMEDYDFIVATPHCVSPGISGVKPPPDDPFDLIIMDEAHHSEAPRWADLLEHFKNTKRLLFTATPFRRDKREVKGVPIYNYPLRLAYDDKVFGNLKFVPVDPPAGADHDIAIARKAEEIYQQDFAAGFDHRLMVRTDSKAKAEQLESVYRDCTKLKLAVVHSGHSLRTIRRALERLKTRELDGIICVAMMGEGFDFPQLKIAAVHSPHKSLAVTLQFIGRFARTTGEKLGDAKFIAVPQDIQAETNELYRESAAWQDIVSNLSAARIEKEMRTKEIGASFSALQQSSGAAADVVLTDLKPYYHVKIYRINSAPNLAKLPDFGSNVEVLAHEVSDEHNSAIILLRQVTRPRWTDLHQFSRIENDLVVLYYDQSSKLLFVNSSRRTLEFYKPFEDFYGNGSARLLSGPRINRVLADLSNPDFFSVGLKNSAQNSNTESYQIKVGPSAQNALSPTDGLMYERGHVMGKGQNEEGKVVTIGYSSSSKVWSSCAGRVGELIEWCKALSAKLSTKGPVVTGTPLDILEVGEEIEALPVGVIGVGWPANVFKEFPSVEISQDDRLVEGSLLDIELSIEYTRTTDDAWIIRMDHPAFRTAAFIQFTLSFGKPTFEWVGCHPELYLIRDGEKIEFLHYLSHYPLPFFLEDFSRVDGSTITFNRNGRETKFPLEKLRDLNWAAGGVDITLEFPVAGVDFASPKSVQGFLGKQLIDSEPGVVFYDHGTGEMADFVTFREEANNTLVVGLYHCKGAGGKAPGDRVGDAYEVCGQVVKCLIWLKKKELLRKRIIEREQSTGGKSRFIKGHRRDLLKLLADQEPKKLEFQIFVVQPGISKNHISEKICHILGAASDYVRRASHADMFLLCSP